MSEREEGESEEQKILREAKQRFADAEAAWSQVKMDAQNDTKFARLGDQWDPNAVQSRLRDGRPCLTINKMPAFCRQIVNDMRQNRPRIKTRAASGDASAEIAKIYDGIIRNIEVSSEADVAYDTGGECAVYGGIGFWRVDVDFEYDDAFDMGIFIRRIANPQAVSWDATSIAADSSDWRYCFVSEMMPKTTFEARWPDKESSDFGDGPIDQGWIEEDMVRVSEYWTREEVTKTIYKLANGEIVDAETYKELEAEQQALPELQIVGERETKSYKVTQRLITGADILETTEWAGSYIPIIPVWGDEFTVEGRRYFHSLIRHVKDAQRMFNFWRTTATEIMAVSPKAQWLMPKAALPKDEVEATKWSNSNQINYPYLIYEGLAAPQKQQPSGLPAGVVNEAAMSADDMKAIMGLYDASLGAKSNETSGIAIQRRMAEGDISTFHFIDNLNRAIRCTGRILVELIPRVYSKPRIMRIIGEDGKYTNIPINQRLQLQAQNGQMVDKIFDITVGKYDVEVEAGPSYTTQRQESAAILTDIIRADTQVAPVLAPLLLKLMDFPESDKASAILATLMPPQARAVFDGTPPPPPGPPPEVAAKMAGMQAEFQMNQQKAAHDAQLEQQRADNRNRLEILQAQTDIEVARQKAAADIEIMRQKASAELELKQREAELAAKLKIIGASQTAQNNTAPGVQ